MEELCSVCLCSERKLSFLSETSYCQLYMEILNEISVYDTSQLCVRLCWECRALLLKLQAFKVLVKTSYNDLMQCIYQDLPQKSLVKSSRLIVQKLVNLSIPVEKVKAETEAGDVLTVIDNNSSIALDNKLNDQDVRYQFPMELKQEVLDVDDHYEPESFVNDLRVDKPKRKKDKVKKVKTNKKPAKVKKKPKKKPQKVPEENLHESDVDTDFDGNEWDGVIKTDVGEKKTEELKCEECDLIFDEKEEFNKHLDSVHVLKETELEGTDVNNVKSKEKDTDTDPKLKPICVECGKVFSSRKTLRYHRNVIHKGLNKHPCPRCGKVYQWKSNLGRHMRSHKARDSDELYCEKCDKRFASVATYRQHLKISKRHVTESEFTFVCNECGKKFVNKTRLRDHIDWDHLKKIKFRCQICNKPFKCHTSLYIHMQNVHANKDKKDNLCHVCGKSYQNAAKLKYHIVALHSGATPYSCPQCNAAFGWYSSLYRHLREVHYKMKVQPNKKCKKLKKPEVPSSLLSQQLAMPFVPPGTPTFKP